MREKSFLRHLIDRNFRMKILCVFGKHAYGDPARGEGYEHANFVPAFRSLGHEVQLFDSFSRRHYRDFAALNAALVATIDQFRPDVIFMTLMSYEVWTETLDWVRNRSCAVLVNWGTDDSWKYKSTIRFLIPHLDCHVTTHSGTLARARRDCFSNVVLSQWAASDGSLREPIPSEQCDFDVSFVGHLYGGRIDWIEALTQAGIEVACFGKGTKGGVVDTATMIDVVNRSRVTLNFSDAGTSNILPFAKPEPQIKARLFEATGAGSCLLTQGAPGIEDYFSVGTEVDVFQSLEELVQKARFYLENPSRRDAMANAGFRRVRSAHTYSRRFEDLLDHLMPLLQHKQKAQRWQLAPEAFAAIAAQHGCGTPVSLIRSFLVAVAGLVLPKNVASRAARRVAFEMSWRLARAKTFSVRGLPGRLFYLES